MLQAGGVRIHAIFGGIGAFAVKFRWVVIAAWLIAGFAVPKFLALAQQRHAGQGRWPVDHGRALGVLMDTFIVRTVLVPGTVIMLGRWNWWPSALSRAGAQPEGSDGPDPDGPASRPGRR